jgi:hypothetical protein
MEVINRGKIIIDIEQGSVKLPTPEFDKFIPPLERVNQQLRTQLSLLNDIGRAALLDAQGGNKWKAGLQNMRDSANAEAAERERVNQLILADRVRRHERQLQLSEAEMRQQEQLAAKQIASAMAVGESLNRIGEGFLRVTRASVLLGYQSDESLQKLLKNLALVQAGFDGFRGASDIIRGVNKIAAEARANGQTFLAAIGSGNIAVAAGAVVVGALGMAWADAARRQREYVELQERFQSSRRNITDQIAELRGPGSQVALIERRIRTLRPEGEDPASALRYLEQQKELQQQLYDAKQAENRLEREKVSTQRQAIENAQEQVRLAEQRLSTERSAVRSYEAAFSKLEAFEQRQLKAAFDKVRRGGSLSEYERNLVDKVGQSGITEFDRAREGRREGARESDLAGIEGATVGASGGLRQFERELDDANKRLREFAEGRDSDAALRSLEQKNEELARVAERGVDIAIKAFLRLEAAMGKQERRSKELEDAAKAEQARGSAIIFN